MILTGRVYGSTGFIPVSPREAKYVTDTYGNQPVGSQSQAGRKKPGSPVNPAARRIDTPKHLISTPARIAACPRCKTPVYTALDEGLRAVVDLAALDPADEIRALLTGRKTYTRLRCGELVYREPDRIRAGLLKGHLHQQHTCQRKTHPAQLELWSN